MNLDVCVCVVFICLFGFFFIVIVYAASLIHIINERDQNVRDEISGTGY